MDLASISPASVVASQMAMTQEAAGMLMMRKVLDMQAAQGAMLVQMMNQTAGLGQNINISA